MNQQNLADQSAAPPMEGVPTMDEAGTSEVPTTMDEADTSEAPSCMKTTSASIDLVSGIGIALLI
jgi:hypothetical protein